MCVHKVRNKYARSTQYGVVRSTNDVSEMEIGLHGLGTAGHGVNSVPRYTVHERALYFHFNFLFFLPMPTHHRYDKALMQDETLPFRKRMSVQFRLEQKKTAIAAVQWVDAQIQALRVVE